MARASGGADVGDSQLRWVGPEKGVIHLATAAVVNAVWDLWAKAEGKPLWKLLADMTPEEIVRCIDFRYITDAHHARRGARDASCARRRRRARSAKREITRDGYPAYTTSAGWLGYSDDKIRRLCREAMAAGLVALQDQGRGATSPTTCAARRSSARRSGPTAS